MLWILAIFLLMSCSSEQPSSAKSVNMDSDKDQQVDTLPLFEKDYLLGRFDPAKDTNFVVIPDAFAARSGMYIRQEVWGAFQKMQEAAQKEGISLKILSATRTFEQQKAIWERKFMERVTRMSRIPQDRDSFGFVIDILRYSSMPGSSRHHWGTDIDLNSLEPAFFNTKEGLKIYDWLSAHAQSYGFCQPYTSKETGRSGYEEEKWHWSYLPLSRPMLHAYQIQITYDDICCFKASEYAEEAALIERFVLGIDPKCLD